MITVLVAMLTSSLMLVVGLVVDGGSARAARSDALDEASSAARAAAQMIDEGGLRRDREVVLDPVAARKAAADFIASTGDKADITITGQPGTRRGPRPRRGRPSAGHGDRHAHRGHAVLVGGRHRLHHRVGHRDRIP